MLSYLIRGWDIVIEVMFTIERRAWVLLISPTARTRRHTLNRRTISQDKARAVDVASLTARWSNTGNVPGVAASSNSMLLLIASLNEVFAPESCQQAVGPSAGVGGRQT